ncbi:MAG: NADPH:quinone reductase [Trizodia sp. TS-e1964]|nr:MAG: NADPH:quinone reductase [Trizodia sp. TS-e1964]
MAPIPAIMKGVLVERLGGPEVLEYKTDLPIPKPAEGEVLVKNSYIGVNFIDTYFRSGAYGSPLPIILGQECEGVVTAVGPGEIYGLKVGDRVGSMASKSYTEYAAAPAAKTIKIPAEIPDSQVAASLIQGLTALVLIREAYPAKAGDWVLVHAAAGGMGLWLCKLLKLIGVKVIGTASTDEKMKLAMEAGASIATSSVKGDGKEWIEVVKRYTDGKGVAAVFDGVGKATFDGSLEVLAAKGSMVSFGAASGAVPPINISVLGAKCLKLVRASLFVYISTREEFEVYATELIGLLASGKLKADIHEIYPLADVKRAHEDLEGRKSTGKLLLKV